MSVDINPAFFLAVVGLVLILIGIMGGEKKSFKLPLVDAPLPVPKKLSHKLLVVGLGILLMLLGLVGGFIPIFQTVIDGANGTASAQQFTVTVSTGGAPTVSNSASLTPLSLSLTNVHTLIPTSTLTLSQTPDSFVTITPTPEPTPLGGSNEIAFISQSLSVGVDAIILYDVSTKKSTYLLDAKYGAGLDWSNDGVMVAFSSDQGDGPQIYVFDSAGNPEPIKTDRVDMRPAWSPDRKQLAFESSILDPNQPSAVSGSADIYIYDFDKGTLRVAISSNSDDVDVNWHPTEEKLVYTSWQSRSADIYEFDLNTKRPTSLIASSASETDPRYSPSGRYIAYTESQSAGGYGVAIYDVEQGKTIKRFVEKNVGLENSDWSPDEKWLVVSCAYGDKASQREICLIEISTGDIHRLTNNQVYDNWPAWLP